MSKVAHSAAIPDILTAAGALIVRGTGVAEVTATGETPKKVGKIHTAVHRCYRSNAEAPCQREMDVTRMKMYDVKLSCTLFDLFDLEDDPTCGMLDTRIGAHPAR